MSDISDIVNADIDLAILKPSNLTVSGAPLDVRWADTKLQHRLHIVSVRRPRGLSHHQITGFARAKQRSSERAGEEVGGHQPAAPEAAQEAVPVVGEKVILNLTISIKIYLYKKCMFSAILVMFARHSIWRPLECKLGKIIVAPCEFKSLA